MQFLRPFLGTFLVQWDLPACSIKSTPGVSTEPPGPWPARGGVTSGQVGGAVPAPSVRGATLTRTEGAGAEPGCSSYTEEPESVPAPCWRVGEVRGKEPSWP